jgi:glycerol-3-phosphate dehydrogenase (NAD(P)+)
VLWAFEQDVAQSINETHENKRYFSGHTVPDSVRATTSLEGALQGAELVVIVVPTHAVREVMTKAKPFIPPQALLCSAAKGIENDTLMLMSHVLRDTFSAHDAVPRLTYLSGPELRQRSRAAGMPTAVVVAGQRRSESPRRCQRAWATDKLRVYSSDDVVGVEIGGALKNVIAIAAGAIDGLGFGHNSRAGMITRGLHEIGLPGDASSVAIR